MLKGGCLCGSVRYETDGEPFHETTCHCADCRRAVGAAGVAWFSVSRAALRFTGDDPKYYASSPKVRRGFCGHCGTSLTYETTDHPAEIDITIASLDDPAEVSPRDHSYTAGKVRWEVVCDGLPAHPHLRPAELRRRPASLVV
jgi:hypothetical protein